MIINNVRMDVLNDGVLANRDVHFNPIYRLEATLVLNNNSEIQMLRRSGSVNLFGKSFNIISINASMYDFDWTANICADFDNYDDEQNIYGLLRGLNGQNMHRDLLSIYTNTIRNNQQFSGNVGKDLVNKKPNKEELIKAIEVKNAFDFIEI